MSRQLPPPSPHPEGATVHTVTRRRGATRTAASGPPRRRRRRRSWRRRTVFGLLALVIVAVVGGLGIFLYAQWRFSQLKKIAVPGLVPRPANAPFNILLVGSDSRAFVDDSSNAAQFGSASETTGQRSDVIMVARIAPALHEIKILSIPRDTYVNIPGSVTDISGPNRINAAFNSGPSLLVQTIKQSFGIPINDYAEIGFPGFEGMVNALGGIWLNFPDQVTDAYSGLSIHQTGCQLVMGKQALALVRSRHLQYLQDGVWQYDPGSDWSRIQRQDAFFQAVIPKLRGVTTSPTGLNGLLGAMTSDVTIDKSLTEGVLLGLAHDFHSSNGSPLATETLPTIPTTVNGDDVLIPTSGPDGQMISQFLAFGTQSATTTAFSTGNTSVDATLEDATTEAPITVTTVPSDANPNDVVTNTQKEPWNPTPCQP